MTESETIEFYKKDFVDTFNKHLQITIKHQYKVLTELDCDHTIYSITDTYISATDIVYNDIYCKNNSPDYVYIRCMLAFILFYNNYSISLISKIINKDRTNIMNTMSNFIHNFEQNSVIKNDIIRTISYLRDNTPHSNIVTKEQFLEKYDTKGISRSSS